MDSLPLHLFQYILSFVSNAKDVAASNCVSKQWKDSIPYQKNLYFQRNLYDKLTGKETIDNIVNQMVSSMSELEELVVYCPFTGAGLASWLSHLSPSLKRLELRMDNLVQQQCQDEPSKLNGIGIAMKLESMKLWSVFMVNSPKWETFQNLRNLEIVGACVEDSALSDALQACPNLTHLSLVALEGLESININLPCLVNCKLDFYGVGNCSLTLDSPYIESLEVQGCSWIKACETKRLRNLSIANHSGRVNMVHFGKLGAVEFLSIRGIQWCWEAVSKILSLTNGVKHLFMKVEFTGDFDSLLPFPEIDLVDFFNSHSKLQKFDMHGAMFAALSQKNSLKNLDSRFMIPSLEEVVITVRSPLNAEQKMSTLESLLLCGRNLRNMTIRILDMKSSHSSADDFFQDICRFRYFNHNIVTIQ
ncbi:F-box protein At1g10780-like [Impatiens glandulifera]|uniref:F-box protein At1g10780-like n=1 Tax=Impatiens glandulifera TaxID=253017 RepID=UPI001FB07E90|nr:F-box protein At1g10780-like [Impatiens glandulifera]